MASLNKKNNLKSIIGLIALVIVLIVAGYFVYKRSVSADVYGTVPTWIDADTANKVNNVWSSTQKAQFLGCTASGYPVKSTLTADELQRFGSNSTVFEGQSEPAYAQYQFYVSKYRLIVTPLQAYTQNGTAFVKFKFTVKNPSETTNHMRLAQIRLTFWRDTPTNATGSPSYWGADQVIALTSGTDVRDLAPNEELSVISNLMPVSSFDAYYTVNFASELYSSTNGQVTSWNGSGSASPVYCVVNPISMSTLKSMNLVSATVTTSTTFPSPTPTLTPTRTATPSSTPSATFTSTSVGGVTDYNFHQGFSSWGASAIVPSVSFGNSEVYLYKFDGPTNSWVYSPGMTTFNTQVGSGYYVYSTDAKTVSLPFAPTSTAGQSLTKGWNLLYNIGNKTLSSLQLTYGSTVSRSAQELITAGVINSKIFIIDDDQAAQACSYFKLLSSSDTAADCTAGVLGAVSTLPTGKNFWVYVN